MRGTRTLPAWAIAAALLLSAAVARANGYDDALRHIKQAQELEAQGKLGALAEYDQALYWNASYGYAAYIHYRKALLFRKQQKPQKALAECREAVKLFPEVNYGFVKRAYNRQKEAKQLLEQLLAMSPREFNKLKKKVYAQLAKLVRKRDVVKLLEVQKLLNKLTQADAEPRRDTPQPRLRPRH